MRSIIAVPPLLGALGLILPGDDVAVSNALEIVFFDVGQGDCAVLFTPAPEPKVIVIDGGYVNTAQRSVVPYLRARGVETIDLMILTHPDMDHVSGLRELMRRFDVTEIWDPGFDHDTDTYENFEDEAEVAAGDRYYSPLEDQIVASVADDTDDAKMRRIVIGSPEQIGTIEIIPLHTDDFLDGPSDAYDRNNSSIVVKVVYGENSILFTGDANGRRRSADPDEVEDDGPLYTEAALLAVEEDNPGILESTVLKAPHHGSLTSSSAQFVEAVRPGWAIINSGVKDDLPRPATLACESKANIVRTDVLDESDTKNDDHSLLIVGPDEGHLIWRQADIAGLLAGLE